MIYIIKHHIKKGSYVAWYDLITTQNESDITYWESTDREDIERGKLNKKEPPYVDALEQHIKEINPKPMDIIIFDIKYLELEIPNECESYLNKLGKKLGIKLVAVSDDVFRGYFDSDNYTFFSNLFDTKSSFSETSNNFNYYRYRATKESYFNSIPELITPFQYNIREKKMNMIIGVDKKERFEVFKYTHNIGLDKESYMSYSAFCSTYDDSELSDSLRKWKGEHIPKILDTPIEKSLEGNVNPQIPPFPYCMNSYVSCILETQIHPSPEIHLSEKSWNPFLSHNIPLILGSSGINQYLKKLGFWMAGDLFDISRQETEEEIIKQYKSNLDIINKMSNEDLREYYTLHYHHIEQNYKIMKKQKFIYNKLNYKQPKSII
jgi:hypothetical protein